MDCPLALDESAELIVGYSAGTLDPRAAAAFERHLESCADCPDRVAGQSAVWAALDQWRALPVSSDFNHKLRQRIAVDENRRWWMWRLLPAVAVCLALAAVLLFRPQVQPPLQVEQVEHALDDLDLLGQIGAAI